MASIARLPSVSIAGCHVTQQVLEQLSSPPKLDAIIANKQNYTRKKQLTFNENNSQPIKIETERHRNSFIHNLCVEMLKDGFRSSFCQLFNLIKSEKETQLKVAADSGLPNEILVQDQPQKLEKLKLHLIDAEIASRRGKMDVVYSSYIALATYFEESEDTYFSNHFYKLCLETSVKVRGDGRRKEAEANFNMGLAYEKQGYQKKAMLCFEHFYSLTTGRLWQMENSDRTLFAIACEKLQNVYTTIAMEVKSSNLSDSIAYLLKAYKVSKEGDDMKGRGDASFLLGCAYIENDDTETAVLYHNEYLKLCEDIDDITGMGKAHRALAKSYEKQMDIDNAIIHLQLFVELSEKSRNLREERTAFSALGEMLNSVGKYEESAMFIERSYKLSKRIKEENKELVRTEYGIVIANIVVFGLCQSLENMKHENIEKILNWKQSRKDVFDVSVPIPKNFSMEKLVEYESNSERKIETDDGHKNNNNDYNDDE